MSLTAEALGVGVALVTSTQITRMVVVMALAEPVYRVWAAGRSDKSDLKPLGHPLSKHL